ncbi:unnamed protein product, partial [Ectocarpus fasciculatus]
GVWRGDGGNRRRPGGGHAVHGQGAALFHGATALGGHVQPRLDRVRSGDENRAAGGRRGLARHEGREGRRSPFFEVSGPGGRLAAVDAPRPTAAAYGRRAVRTP